MRKKRQGRVSHDRWLVSYADFITLLFAFFVVLFATGQSDKMKKVELAVSIQSAFNQMGIFESRSKFPPMMQLPAAGSANRPVSVPPPLPSVRSMSAVKEQIRGAAGPEMDRGFIGLQDSPDGLIVSLEEAGFFESGSAEVRLSALPVLNRIAAVLPNAPMRVEGHTDNIAIHTARFTSNWELSSSRASNVARLLLSHPNIRAEELSVAGYAEFHPAASNATAEGRARNRRVDIVLLK